MRIGFCYNVLHQESGGVDSQLDFDEPGTIQAIKNTLLSLGHTVVEIEANAQVFERLAKAKDQIDLVFNIAEGLYGDARESWVPLACEILHIPYTHSTPTVQALKLDKTLAKLAVAGLGVLTPQSFIIEGELPQKLPHQKFPLIIKPNSEGSSIGIFNANVVDDAKQLSHRVRELRHQGLGGVLIAEEYIAGREFTVGLLGNGDSLQVLPIIEQNFNILPPGTKPIAGYELKWLIEDKLQDLTQAYFCPAPLTPKMQRQIQDISKTIFLRLGVRDCARIDYRMTDAGKVYFLELNTLPGINPDPHRVSYFPLAAKKAGLSYPQLLESIIAAASRRWRIPQSN